MTELMRQCQDSITECMEAMLVEVKRDHSLVRAVNPLGLPNSRHKEDDPLTCMTES